MDKLARTRDFMDFLLEEGYRPTLDHENDIVFKIEGKSYLVIFDESDELFFHIIYPNFWSIDSNEERQQAMLVALEVSRNVKVAKVYLNRDKTSVWASVELFSASSENNRLVFERSLSSIQYAVQQFKEKMNN